MAQLLKSAHLSTGCYTDYEIGRVIQEVEDMGKLDDTLIIYICGDNGTSPEGTLLGTPNQYTAYNGILERKRSGVFLAANYGTLVGLPLQQQQQQQQGFEGGLGNQFGIGGNRFGLGGNQFGAKGFGGVGNGGSGL